MTKPLRIAVADNEVEMRNYFERMLPRMGYEVVSVADNGRQLVADCHQLRPDLVITDIKMPEMDGIEAAVRISRDEPVPVILVSAYHDQGLIERAEQDYVLAYLVKPIKQADLETAIAIARRRFEQFQTLRQEATNLRQALEDRKVIEHAKRVLMTRTGLDEQQAFRRLQKVSSDNNMRLVEVVRCIALAEDVFQLPQVS